MSRRKFTKEFKEEAVSLVFAGGQSLHQASQDLGVGLSTLQRWVSERREMGADAFPGNGRQVGQEQELTELRKRVRQLEMERDILKKATAFFAKGTL